MTRVQPTVRPVANTDYDVEYSLKLSQQDRAELANKFDCIRAVFRKILDFGMSKTRQRLQHSELRNIESVLKRLERKFDSLSQANVTKYNHLITRKQALEKELALTPDDVVARTAEVAAEFDNPLSPYEIQMLVQFGFESFQSFLDGTDEECALALQCESPSLRLFKPADTPGLHIFGNRIHWTDTGCPDLTFEFSIDGVRSDSNAVYSPDDETIRIYLQEDRLENGKRDYWGLLTKRRSNSRPQKSAQVRQVSTEDPQDRIRHFEELIDRQQKQIRKVEKAIERSMRTYNALSFDENGKYIKGAPLLVSNNCQEHKDRLAKLNRKLRGNIKQLEKLKAQTR